MFRTNAPRRITCAASLVVLVALAGCDDATAPSLSELSPEEIEVLGMSIATEVETGLTALVASDFVGEIGAVAAASGARPRLDVANLAAISAPECATTTPAVPVDDDEDGVPTTVTFTFTLPACQFQFGNGSMSITGSLQLTDPQPQTAGFGYGATLNDLTVTFTGEDGSISLVRDGTMSVSASPSQLMLQQDLDTYVSGTGFPTTSVLANWSATFVPAAGSALVFGEPLPNGVFTPSSSVSINQPGQAFTFTLAAPTPLQYDATCAAEAISPFAAGELRATIGGPEGTGYIRVRWIDCGEPEVVFVAVTN